MRSSLIYRYYTSGGDPTINGDGQQAILVIGDSTGGAGTNGNEGPGPTPDSGTAYYYRRSNNTVIEIGANDLEFAADPPGDGSQWPQFAIDYYTKIGNKAVIIPAAAGGSEISPNGDDNNWTESGDLYSAAVTDANNCMTLLGVTKLKAIFVFLGINDSLAATTLSTVQSDLEDLISRLQTDFPDTDIILFAPGANGSSNTARLFSIRHYIKTVCEENERCFLLGGFIAASPAGLLTDGIHMGQTGQNHIGSIAARWFENSTYDKWARSIISSFYSDLTDTRKALIAPLDSTVLASYLNHEALYLFKNLGDDDVWADWAFHCVPNNLVAVTVNANDSIETNGTSQTMRPSFQPSIAAFKATQNDFFYAAKVKTVTTAAGTSGVLYGSLNAGGTIGVILMQVNTNVLRYRINDVTNTDWSGGDTKFQDDTEYGVTRNSGTKALLKNGEVVHSASVASTGLLDSNPNLGSYNNNGTAGSFIAGEYEWFRAGKHIGTDHEAFYAFMENIINHWND